MHAHVNTSSMYMYREIKYIAKKGVGLRIGIHVYL